MRIRALHLLKFGPFTDVRLDFGGAAGMHVVFGRNEAGKSTSLRALTGLLYGIPSRTLDAHRHRPDELRIGGTLADEAGNELVVVRRKGLKRTLLDANEQAIDEAALRKLLGGVSEETFRAVFGLDHEALRRGAEALLAGKGELGETLFGAGLGGRALHKLLDQLRTEAEEIWTQKARSRPLVEAMNAFKDAHQRARYQATDPAAVLAQRRALEELIEDRRQNDARRRELSSKRHRLMRAQRLLPLFARRDAARARRAELGDVPLLASTAARDREQAQRELAEARAELERIEADLAALGARAEGLSIPRALLDDAAVIEALPARLSGYAKAAEELPRREGELARVEAELAATLARVGRVASAADVPVVDATVAARVRKLSLQHEALEQRVDKAREAVRDAQGALARAEAREEGLPAPRDPAPLRAALDRARAQGDLEARRDEAAADVAALARRVEAGIASLGLWRGTASELVRLALPPAESVEHAERERARIEQRRERAEKELRREEERARAASRELDALERGGHVPSEAELAAARGERDATFARLRSAAETGVAMPAREADAFAALVRRADDVADRLRREVDRVSQLGRLTAEREDAARRAAAIAEEQRALDAELEASSRAFVALFAPSGVEARSPAEMRGFLARHAALGAHAEQLASAEAARDRLEREIDARRRELAEALALAGEAAAADTEPLGTIVARASRALDGIDEAARARREVEGARRDAALRLAAEERALAAAIEAQGAWKTAWRGSVAAVGLTEEASPEEASAALAVIADASRLGDDVRRLRARIAEVRADAADLAAQVGALARRHAPELAGLPIDEAGAAVVRRLREAKEALGERERIERALAEDRDKARALSAKASRAEARLALLRAAARVESDAELERAERVSDEARELDRQVAELEDRILEQGEGGTLPALAAEIAGVDADALPDELDAAAEALAEADDEARRIDVRIGAQEKGLEQYAAPSSAAADALEEAEAHLARVRELAARWARSRIASVVLEREIERYRERHQGPVLARASELVAKLTRGSIVALRAGFDDADEPVLRCVRDGGRELGVEGLSDGTRDQLYLALRISTLERHAETSPPMPLVVDDVLIHFDDERAAAALAAFAELSEKTQVLFFTHHARLVEIAKSACPAGSVAFHALG